MFSGPRVSAYDLLNRGLQCLFLPNEGMLQTGRTWQVAQKQGLRQKQQHMFIVSASCHIMSTARTCNTGL